MVSTKLLKEGVVTALKVYGRDAAVGYSTAFIGGVVAGASWIGLKDGLGFGKDLAKGAKKLAKKAFTKKPKKVIEPPAQTNGENPENNQE